MNEENVCWHCSCYYGADDVECTEVVGENATRVLAV